MLHKFATILFVDKPCIVEASRMLPYGLFVCVECCGNVFKCKTTARGDEEQNCNTSMVSHPFQVSFHLFWGFHFLHKYQYTQHSHILKFVRVLYGGNGKRLENLVFSNRIARSSNGRTVAFEAINWGSNPCRAAGQL